MVSEVQSGWQASLQSGLEACSRHDYSNGKECFSKALEQAHQESAPEHAIGEIFFNIAWCLQALGDYPAAEQRYKQSLGTVERCYGVGSEAAIKVLQQLSGMCRSANRLEEAEAYAQRARLAQAAPPLPVASPTPAQARPAEQPQIVNQPSLAGPSKAPAQGEDAQAPTRIEEAPRAASKPSGRAGIVMDGVPVATNQSAFVAGSMFKAKVDANQAQSSDAAERQSAADFHRSESDRSTEAPGAERPSPSADRPLAPMPPRDEQSAQPAPKRKLPRALATAAGDEEDLEYSEIVSDSGESQGPFIIEDLIHPREKLYRKISGAVGCWVYFLSLLYFGIGLVLAPLTWLGSFIAQGLYLGNLRGHGIRVSNRQFPEVQKYLEQYCTIMRMEVPEVLVVNHHGLLNAFAHRLQKKDVIVICSDVLELAYEHGEKELAFVVVHELSHLKLGHLKWHWLHLPGYLVPFLGTAYSRACEYSCDRIARHLVPDGALFGLVSLAAGTKLYRNINLNALYEQAEQDWGFWTWFAEIQSTHPNLVNRIRAIGLKDAEIKKRMRNRG